MHKNKNQPDDFVFKPEKEFVFIVILLCLFDLLNYYVPGSNCSITDYQGFRNY